MTKGAIRVHLVIGGQVVANVLVDLGPRRALAMEYVTEVVQTLVQDAVIAM